jgi:hypothetical protein
MKLNQHIKSARYFFSSGVLLTGHCSGVFVRDFTRAALLAIVLGTMVVLATSCASTGDGVTARFISPVENDRQATSFETDGLYQSWRSPAFDPDLFGS